MVTGVVVKGINKLLVALCVDRVSDALNAPAQNLGTFFGSSPVEELQNTCQFRLSHTVGDTEAQMLIFGFLVVGMLGIIFCQHIQRIDPSAVGIRDNIQILTQRLGMRACPVELSIVQAIGNVVLDLVFGDAQIVLGHQTVDIQVVQGDQHFAPLIGRSAVGNEFAGEVVFIDALLNVVGIVPAIPDVVPVIGEEGNGVGVGCLDVLQQLNELIHGIRNIFHTVNDAQFHHGACAVVPALGGHAGILGGQNVHLAVGGDQIFLNICPAAFDALIKHLDEVRKLILILINAQQLAGQRNFVGLAGIGLPDDVGVVIAGKLQQNVVIEVCFFDVFPLEDHVELLQQNLIQNGILDRVLALQVCRHLDDNLFSMGVRRLGRAALLGDGVFFFGFCGGVGCLRCAACRQTQQHHQSEDQGNRFFHFWGSSFDLFIGSLLEAAHV